MAFEVMGKFVCEFSQLENAIRHCVLTLDTRNDPTTGLRDDVDTLGLVKYLDRFATGSLYEMMSCQFSKLNQKRNKWFHKCHNIENFLAETQNIKNAYLEAQELTQKFIRLDFYMMTKLPETFSYVGTFAS